MPRAAAFFDLDKTVIAKSSTLAMGRPFYEGGLVTRTAMLKGSYAQFVYLIAGADAEQMDKMRDALKAMCTGWEVDKVRAIVDETLHAVVDPLVYDEAIALVEAHHADDLEVVIVSSSGEEVVGPIAEMVGADHAIATRMVVENGRYTGDIAFYAYGEHKAEAMRELAAARGYDLAECYAYSDSMTDLPMLEAVGHPIAVNPDKALRRHAIAQGWEVRDFVRPVALHSRVPQLRRPSPPVLAGAAAVTLGAAAALAWRATHARRRARSS